MVVITLLRGFKVPLSTLDAFLTANGIPEEHERLCTGSPPFYHDESDKVTTLLRRKAGGKTRVFMPYRSSFNHSFTACIAYDWVWAFAQRRLKPDEMISNAPAGFEELRNEILSHGKSGEVEDEEYSSGVFIVVTDERGWMPPEVGERYKNIKCDQCEMTFDDGRWKERQLHRQEVHGSREGLNPLPENV